MHQTIQYVTDAAAAAAARLGDPKLPPMVILCPKTVQFVTDPAAAAVDPYHVTFPGTHMCLTPLLLLLLLLLLPGWVTLSCCPR
jgi:hypothetical protein